MKRLPLMSLLLILTLIIAACGASEPSPTAVPTAVPAPTEVPMAAETANTIVDIAVNDGRFNTLVAAVTAAGLVETLSGEGPFSTVAEAIAGIEAAMAPAASSEKATRP